MNSNKSIVFYAAFPQSGLYVMEANGSNRVLILPTSEKIVLSAAPNGDGIAFASSRQKRMVANFTISANQGEKSLRQLTSTIDADNYLPTWSSDGQISASDIEPGLSFGWFEERIFWAP